MKVKDDKDQGRDGKGKFVRKHGAFDKRVLQRFEDPSTPEGGLLQSFIEGVVYDKGGSASMNTKDLTLLEAARTTLIPILRIAEYAEGQEDIIDGKGKLLPVLANNLLAYINSLRLTMVELYTDVDKRQRSIELEDIIREAKSNSTQEPSNSKVGT